DPAPVQHVSCEGSAARPDLQPWSGGAAGSAQSSAVQRSVLRLPQRSHACLLPRLRLSRAERAQVPDRVLPPQARLTRQRRELARRGGSRVAAAIDRGVDELLDAAEAHAAEGERLRFFGCSFRSVGITEPAL